MLEATEPGMTLIIEGPVCNKAEDELAKSLEATDKVWGQIISPPGFSSHFSVSFLFYSLPSLSTNAPWEAHTNGLDLVKPPLPKSIMVFFIFQQQQI